MKQILKLPRRQFFRVAAGAATTLLLAGCEKLSQTEWFPKILGAGESLNQKVHGVLGGRRAMAPSPTSG